MGNYHRRHNAYGCRVSRSGHHDVKAPLASWEKHFAAFFVLAVAAGGSYLILKLQHHLRVTRKRIKKEDPNPWLRGFDVAIGLVIALIISAAAVCYSFWR